MEMDSRVGMTVPELSVMLDVPDYSLYYAIRHAKIVPDRIIAGARIFTEHQIPMIKEALQRIGSKRRGQRNG